MNRSSCGGLSQLMTVEQCFALQVQGTPHRGCFGQLIQDAGIVSSASIANCPKWYFRGWIEFLSTGTTPRLLKTVRSIQREFFQCLHCLGGFFLHRAQELQGSPKESNLESQVAQHYRTLYPKVAHDSLKMAHNYRPLAFQEGLSSNRHAACVF